MKVTNRPSLPALEAFVVIARHRSFRRAADELGVSRSALSHLVQRLEDELGVRLFHRTTRSLAPTGAGEALLDRLRPALASLDEALAEVDPLRDEPRGTLRINSGALGARLLVRHVLPVFRQRHPRVAVELVTEERLVDIVEDGFDAGVRLVESVPRDMIAVRFGGEARFVAVASPTYLSSRGTPRTPDDLRHHDCLRLRLGSGKLYRWELERRGKALVVDVPGSLVLDDNALLVEAAVAGLGIAFVPIEAAWPALDERALRVVLAAWSPPFEGLALYYPGHRRVPVALRAFIDTLKAARFPARARPRR